MFSFIGALAFVACALGLMSCFVLTPQQGSIKARNAALHLFNTAQIHNANQVYGLYVLSENKALEAVRLNPFQYKNWDILSDALFRTGNNKMAFKAQKIAFMFDGNTANTAKAITHRSFSISMNSQIAE